MKGTVNCVFREKIMPKLFIRYVICVSVLWPEAIISTEKANPLNLNY